MSLCTILTLCILALLALLYTCPGESYALLETIGTKVTHVGGVPFHDQKSIMLNSALASGMMTPEAIMTYLPRPVNKGRQAYFEDAAITDNTLELSSTFQQQRLALASANTNYIPAEGMQNSKLWIQRAFVDQLNQPGFTAQPVNPAKYPYF